MKKTELIYSIFSVILTYLIIQLTGATIAYQRGVNDLRLDASSSIIMFGFMMVSSFVFLKYISSDDSNEKLNNTERVGLFITGYMLFFMSLILLVLQFNIVLVLLFFIISFLLYWKWRMWFTVNMIAIISGVAMLSEMGRLFTPSGIIVLLALLSIYDYIAVYITDYMEEIAMSAYRKGLPVLIQYPSLYEDETGSNELDENAVTIGLGDFILPSIFPVTSFFSPYYQTFQIYNLPLTKPFIGSLIGVSIGFIILISVVEFTDDIHPGLPILNAGSVIGFIVGALSSGTAFIHIFIP